MILSPVREDITRAVRPALLAILGAVALLLLIACANVTSLLLARAAQREGEFTVRVALGASRQRVISQLLTESVLLATIGGAAGIALPHVGVKLLVAMMPAGLMQMDAVALDARVLAFALVTTTLAGILSGLAPALMVSRRELHGAIKRAGHRVGGSRRARSTLVVAEIAIALVLLVGTGLLLRSLTQLLAVSPGLDPRNLLTMQVQISGPRYDNDTIARAFFDQALRNVGALPGVESAGFVSQLPLGGNFDSYGVHSELKPSANASLDPSADRYAVSPDYIETMKIPLLRGRSIGEQDVAGAPEVVLINETFAKQNWPNEDPIGQRVRVGDPTKGPWRTIVGIVGDVHHVSLDAPLSKQIYVPEVQWQFVDGSLDLAVRTRTDPANFTTAVRAAIWAVDKNQVITQVATMESVLASSAARRRFALTLFESFAAVALVLAAAGIYGVLAGTVAERAREIGIRAALGASRGDILRLVIRQGLVLAAIGIAIGAGAAMLMSRSLTSLLFNVAPADPLTFAMVVAVLFGVALAACSVPAWRATQLDPGSALR